MNTVTVATAVEAHLVTTVTNNTSTRGSVATGNRDHPVMVVANGYSVGVPTLVTNGMIGGGRTNPAGPQLEEDDKLEGGMIGGEDNHMNLLNSSPDEHEPLLRREQPPAESEPLPHVHQQSRAGNILSGRGSNSNNNNNRMALKANIKIQGIEVKPERMIGPEVSQGRRINSPKPELDLASQQISGSPAIAPVSNLENKILLSGPAGGADSAPSSAKAPAVLFPEAPASQAQEPATETSTSSSKALVLDALTLAPEIQALKFPTSDPEAPVLEDSTTVMNPKASPLEVLASENPAPETPPLESHHSETAAEASAPEPAALQSPALNPQTPVLLRPQMGPAKSKRPERPCSLDLSSSCISSGEPRLNV